MPDISVKVVWSYGDIHLNDNFVLRDVLYIPSFKYNLLSVGKILKEREMRCIFHDDHGLTK